MFVLSLLCLCFCGVCVCFVVFVFVLSLLCLCLPIVREVGGLKDTVLDYDKFPNEATGFGFQEPSAEALLITMQRALLFYLQHPERMLEVQQRAMLRDFSWKESALEYIKMYHFCAQ